MPIGMSPSAVGVSRGGGRNPPLGVENFEILDGR